MNNLDDFFRSDEERFMYMPLIIPEQSTWGYQYKISKNFIFEQLIIKFNKSASKNYKDAVNIASLFSNFKPISKASDFNIVTVTSYRMLLEYEKLINELLNIICNWKKTVIILNDSIVDNNTIRDLFHILSISITSCEYSLPKITPHEVKGSVVVSDNIITHEKLPYPTVLYPGQYGTFFAFKKNAEDENLYLCSCCKTAVYNFMELVKQPDNFSSGLGQYYIQQNIDITYRHHFPIGFLEYISSSTGETYEEKIKNFKGELFKDNLCHSCNKEKPYLTYCIPMYGTKFKRTYGWYINQKELEYGLYQGQYKPININSSLPEEIKETVINRNILLIKPRDSLSPYQEDEVTALNKLIYNYIENSVRENFSVSLIGQKWTNETTLYKHIVTLFGKDNVIFHHRPDWLQGLEIDIFIPHISLGVEYQGIQHYRPMDHWGGEEAFTKLRLHDIKKKNLCNENNVTLIYFRFDEIINLTHVKERLKDHLIDQEINV